jgi:hypothetical protein
MRVIPYRLETARKNGEGFPAVGICAGADDWKSVHGWIEGDEMND